MSIRPRLRIAFALTLFGLPLASGCGTDNPDRGVSQTGGGETSTSTGGGTTSTAPSGGAGAGATDASPTGHPK